MKKAILTIFFAVFLLATMTGCLRSAATPTTATATLAYSLPTQNVVSIAQTATAIAAVKLTGTPSSISTNTTPGAQATNPFVVTPTATLRSVATNTPTGPTPTVSRTDYSFDPAPNSLYPRISVAWVDADLKVGIRTYGFPSTGTYVVSMGVGPRGGTIVTTGSAGTGTSFAAVYDIPAALKGVSPIYVRVDFSDGTWAVNWFYNLTTR